MKLIFKPSSLPEETGTVLTPEGLSGNHLELLSSDVLSSLFRVPSVEDESQRYSAPLKAKRAPAPPLTSYSLTND